MEAEETFAAATTLAVNVQGLRKSFRRGRTEIVAVDDVSFTVPSGRTMGIVGESGSGKSTVARCLLGLVQTDGGTVEVLGRLISGAARAELRTWRRDMQIVFQEPYESLNPRMRVGTAIAEPLILHTRLSASDRRERVGELLGLVSLDTGLASRYPHELSGGQQQRVNIARALATHPKVLVLDEPTSSLDVSVRAGVLELLSRLQRELDLTYILISHDFETIRALCDRVAVMYLGRLVEDGPSLDVMSNPAHPYTQELLEAELSLDPDKPPLPLRTPLDARQDSEGGCIYAPRCLYYQAACSHEVPPLEEVADAHHSACLRTTEVTEHYRRSHQTVRADVGTGNSVKEAEENSVARRGV